MQPQSSGYIFRRRLATHDNYSMVATPSGSTTLGQGRVVLESILAEHATLVHLLICVQCIEGGNPRSLELIASFEDTINRGQSTSQAMQPPSCCSAPCASVDDTVADRGHTIRQHHFCQGCVLVCVFAGTASILRSPSSCGGGGAVSVSMVGPRKKCPG
jgi:hypothetical protein